MSDRPTPEGFRAAIGATLDLIVPEGLHPGLKAAFDQSFADCKATGFTDIEAIAMAIIAGVSSLAPKWAPIMERNGDDAAAIASKLVTVSAAIALEVRS